MTIVQYIPRGATVTVLQIFSNPRLHPPAGCREPRTQVCHALVPSGGGEGVGGQQQSGGSDRERGKHGWEANSKVEEGVT